MAWAVTADVLNRWVGDNPPSVAVVDTFIGDAETLIRAEYADIQARIDDATLPLGQVVMVVARMVIRALRNPDNARTTQEQVGPFGRSLTFGGDEPGGLFLTEQDRKLLGELGSAGSGAFSVDTVGRVGIHADVCALNFGAAYCSCGADLAGYPLWETST